MPDTNLSQSGETKQGAGGTSERMFLLDTNLGLPMNVEPWTSLLPRLGLKAVETTDLPKLDKMMADHEADISFMPIADFHRLTSDGDTYYRGLALATSKFTGLTNLPSVLVVGKDDPARSFDDLEGAAYGFINNSCSSSYFPPAVMLQKKGKKLADFLKITQTPAWQGQIDAVISGKVRATMVPEDTWRTTPSNAETTKVIDRYDTATAAVVVARHDLDAEVRKVMLDALVAWEPKWEAIYGAFRPFYYADVHAFFHDLDQLPPGM